MRATDFITELRRLSTAELEDLGQRSLLDHVVAQAAVARAKHGPLDYQRLDALLRDPGCVRHPVRLVYEFGEMAPHQFAQPDRDWRDETGRGRVLYLRPLLRDRPDLTLLAVAYFIPVINYGDVVTDAHCLAYGAELLGFTTDEFYRRLCGLADTVGAEPRAAGPVAGPSPACGGGCAG